jgi:hypothetical protein
LEGLGSAWRVLGALEESWERWKGLGSAGRVFEALGGSLKRLIVALGGFWERLEGLVSAAGRVLKALEIAEGSYSDLVGSA